MHIFDKFEYLCDLKGVTKATAYKEMGINKATISLWQTARDKGEPVIPSTKNAIKLSEYFGHPTDYFLCENDFSEQKEKHSTEGEVPKALTPDRYRDFLSELSVEDLLALHAELGKELKGRMGK